MGDAPSEALAHALALAGAASLDALATLLEAPGAAAWAVGDGTSLVEDALHRAILSALLAGMGRVAERLPGVSVPSQQASPSASVPAGSAAAHALANVPPGLRAEWLAALAPTPTPAEEEAPGPDVPPLPLVEAAVSELRARRLLPRREADALDAQARRAALAVTLDLPARAMARVQAALTEAVASGASHATFRERLRDAMPEGVFPRADLETAFRDAVNTAYHGGMERLLGTPGVGDHFPFMERVPIRDSRLSDVCALASRSGINGTGVYRRDDPAWGRVRPPSHHNCRCGVNPLTAREAARRGVAGDAGRVALPAALERLLSGARP